MNYAKKFEPKADIDLSQQYYVLAGTFASLDINVFGWRTLRYTSNSVIKSKLYLRKLMKDWDWVQLVDTKSNHVLFTAKVIVPADHSNGTEAQWESRFIH